MEISIGHVTYLLYQSEPNINNFYKFLQKRNGTRRAEWRSCRADFDIGRSRGRSPRIRLPRWACALWKRQKMGSFERRSAGKCSRDGCKKCNLRCNLHYLHQGNLKFVIYLLTCTPPTFFRNPTLLVINVKHWHWGSLEAGSVLPEFFIWILCCNKLAPDTDAMCLALEASMNLSWSELLKNSLQYVHECHVPQVLNCH